MARPKGSKNNDAQNAALARGRAKGAEITRARAARSRERKAKEPNKKSRHQMLVDGELSVDELDDIELQKFRGRDVDGEFKGRIAPLSAKIREAIRQRLMQQMQQGFESFLPRAQAILEEIAESGENESARVKATDILLQRGAGKVPDVVKVGAIDPWAQVLEEAMKQGEDEMAEAARERLGAMTRKGDE